MRGQRADREQFRAHFVVAYSVRADIVLKLMIERQANTDDLLREGASQILARATDANALDSAALLPRLRTTLDKYLLRDRPRATPEEIRQFLEGLRADDLCLVVACERGDEAAWSALIERFRAPVLSAARSVSAGAAEAEELAQSVWAELYGLRTRADGRPAGKLGYYSGCGSLGGWLQAVVRQMAVDRHRRTSRLVQTEEAADFDRLAQGDHHGADGFKNASSSLDPERTLANTEAAEAVQTALARVIGELAPEDRLLIKLYYFDGLRLREAGAVLGVHEATASRRLSRLHGEVRRGVEASLLEHHGWRSEDVARALGEVAAHMETDLRQVLTEEAMMAGQKPK